MKIFLGLVTAVSLFQAVSADAAITRMPNCGSVAERACWGASGSDGWVYNDTETGRCYCRTGEDKRRVPEGLSDGDDDDRSDEEIIRSRQTPAAH